VRQVPVKRHLPKAVRRISEGQPVKARRDLCYGDCIGPCLSIKAGTWGVVKQKIFGDTKTEVVIAFGIGPHYLEKVNNRFFKRYRVLTAPP